MSTEPAFLPAAIELPALDDAALADLARAVATLERSSFAARVSALLGRQVGAATQLLPAPVLTAVNRATTKALQVALRGAIRSLRGDGMAPTANRLHLALSAMSGAAGGAFGLAALPVELPVSTTIILRSIADIARHEGEDLSRPEGLLACLEVFALGNGPDSGPAGESGYLAIRTLLAKSVTEAARHIVQRGVADEAAPAIVRFLNQIAARFGTVVGQKALGQAVPIIGALTGAAVNAAFTDHFQALAHAHFTVRRLERIYGSELIRDAFERLSRKGRDKPADAPGRDAQPVSASLTRATAYAGD